MVVNGEILSKFISVNTNNNSMTYGTISSTDGLTQNYIDFQTLSENINDTYFENIKSHIANFSAFGSRYTGYSGYEKAAAYIEDFFKKNLNNPSTITFPLTVPLEQETKLSFGANNYTAYTLLPNSVHTSQTPKDGIIGTLIYGNLGEFSDLDGKKIDGSIVALEFNSQDNWINVASLGAKGVIFLPPNDTNRYEAEDKVIDIPLNFPRVYVTDQTADLIRQTSIQNNQSIKLYSKMKWTTIDAKNIVGIYPGISEDKVVISAYYDSSSIVPSLSPGTDEASGIATLLELIRVMKDNDIVPQKTIMFIAFSGHNQAAAGAREFVYQNIDNLNIDSGIKMMISLDLSATTNKVGLTSYGYLHRFKLGFTAGTNLENRIKDIVLDYLFNYASIIKKESEASFDIKTYVNKENFEDIAPITYFGDQEPFVASNVIGVSFFTSESHRLRYNTPFDLAQYMQFDQLKSQVIYSISSIVQLVSEPALNDILDLKPKSFSLKHTTHVGYGNIEGHVKEYNESTAWVSNIPNALVRVTSYDERSDSYGVYSLFTKANADGFYEIHGISSSQPDYPLEFQVEAYYIDDEGKLTKSINLGTRGQLFKHARVLTSSTITINPTVFDSGTVSLFEVTHPYTQTPVKNLLNFQVLNPDTRSKLFSYGYIGAKTVSLVFLAPDTPSILVGQLPDDVVAVYATNSSEEAPRGSGFMVKQGEFKNLGIAAYISTKDFLSITQTYVDLYTQYNIYDALVDENFQESENMIATALLLKSNFEYSASNVIIKQAQISSFDSFDQARGVITGGTWSTIFFAILLIPFAFAISALLFDFQSGMKRIVATSIIYGMALGFFYVVHPGLHLSSNIGMIIIGVIATIFVFPALWMIFQEGYDFIKTLRITLVGSHFADTSRTSTILVAMSTGISRMKKRKGRTIIALSGIILITFSLTLFTSASTQVSVFSRGNNVSTPYNGIYFRTKFWDPPLSENMLDIIEVQYGNELPISTRWWLYPAVGSFTPALGGYANITNLQKTKGWESWTILGMTPDEINFHPIESTLISGRWFSDPSEMVSIIPSNAADELGVSVNDTVLWAGVEFTIIGIMDGNKFDEFKDFDDEQITPKDLKASSPNVHIIANQTFIIPSLVAKQFGANLASISILSNQTISESIAGTISTTYGRFIEVRVGLDDVVEIYKRSTKSVGRGFIDIGLPLVIAILLMVNTSISTVYESKKEINIFTSLGLAPFHIAGLFLAEFLVYAILGSLLGYLSGITVAVVMSNLGLLPESLSINYSSGSVINALGFGMAGILLATIYPLRISAKMSVPSVRRSWELSTSPENDNWTISLPFVAASEQEAMGIIEFLREYFSIYESDSVGGVFFAEKIKVHTSEESRKSEKHLTAVVNLAPFDMGIKQTVDLFTYLDEINNRFVFQIDLIRLDGILSVWESSVKSFINGIRKQLLIWRSLPKHEKLAKSQAFNAKLNNKEY